MVAPAYNTAGTVYTSTTITGTHTVNVPAHAAGSALILMAELRNGNNDGVVTAITTSGWTQVPSAGGMYGAAQAARFCFGYKVGNGSETTVQFTATGGTTGPQVLCRVYNFTHASGFATATMVQSVGSDTGGGTSQAWIIMPNVAARTGGADDLCIALSSSPTSETVTNSTGESGGDWTQPVAASSATNGTITIHTSSSGGAAAISGGTATLSVAAVSRSIGFRLVPGSAAASLLFSGSPAMAAMLAA